MNYLLDTNVIIALLKDDPLNVRKRFKRACKASTMGVPSVVLFELWYGVARSTRRQENAERLRVFLSGSVELIPFDEDDAIAAGNLRAELIAAGTPIGPYDVMIAAQTLRLDTTLVTANVAEFKRVRGLRWEDWSKV